MEIAMPIPLQTNAVPNPKTKTAKILPTALPVDDYEDFDKD
jgi:hypothetical protein